MVRAGRGAAVRPRTSYVEEDGSEEEEERPTAPAPIKKRAIKTAAAATKKPVNRVTNGKRPSGGDDATDQDDEIVPVAKKSKPYREQGDSSGDEFGGDAGELEGDDSDFEIGSSKKKKSPVKRKKTVAAAKTKKSPAKKKPAAAAGAKKKLLAKAAATPSRGSQRAAAKAVRYSESDGEEEDEEEDEEEEEEETPPRKSIKQARQAQKKSSSGGGSSRKAAHPAVSQMIPEAIRMLGENPRKGSSLAAIKGMMAEEWGVDIRHLAPKIKNFLLNAIKDGEILQTKGKGASGRFTLPGLKGRKKKKRSANTLTKKWDADPEPEYKPGKTARDEERERLEQEIELRRQQRREEEARKLEEKANKPKKTVVRRTEWEVEFIKAMKIVDEKTWYLVKFENWSKPSWEPEEHLAGCQDIIDNFLLEEKVRLAEEDEKRRREEEEGKYEVCRILEVKFNKSNKDKREFLIRWKGHGEEMDSWEPEENLDCQPIIERFMKRFEKRLEASEKSLREAPKKVERLQFSNSARVGRRNNGFRVTYEGMDE